MATTPGASTKNGTANANPATRRQRPSAVVPHPSVVERVARGKAEHVARAIAKTVHKGQTTRTGSPVFEHLRRVAAAVPSDARTTAWLHDVLERTDLTIADLRSQGVSPVELSALVLLTRPTGDDYRSYLERIADAPGPAGALARIVKLADLEDHLADSRGVSASTPPYTWGRRTILLAQTRAS